MALRTDVPNFALVGRTYSGKSHIANMLQANFGYSKVALADEVKADVRYMWNNLHPEHALSKDEFEDCKGVFRRMLQGYGTDVMRDWYGGKDYWLKQLDSRIDDLCNSYVVPPIVIDDIRFQNEAQHYFD